MGIFRSYDIRGIYGKDLDEHIMKRIGAAFAAVSTKTIVVASDGRASSGSLKRSFVEGFGRDVIDLGMLPLGVGMLHAFNKHDYAYITASHLTSEWNGVKFFHKSGIGFMENENKEVEKIFSTVKPSGKASTVHEAVEKTIEGYIDYTVKKSAPSRKLDVVLDCGNGMASVAARELFTRAGFNVSAIFDKMDCSFPNRNPDPVEDGLHELKKRAVSADVGFAYDGDGDRMVLVDDMGRKLTPEQTAYLILLDAVKFSGPVVANVECTRMIDDIAGKFGKKVVRVPVGHTFLMEAVQRHGACFGVEAAGHYALPYMAPFDDSLMVSLYTACVLSRQTKKLSEIVDEIRTYPFERVSVDCSDDEKFDVVDRLRKKFSADYRNVNVMDGVRIDFPDGWILVRASNTSPIIRLTVEADSRKRLEELKKEFLEILQKEIG